MELNTSRLKLREILFSDLDAIHELHSMPETDEFNTLGIPENIETSKKLILEWLESQNETPRKKYVFCIENKEKDFLGLMCLSMGKTKYKNAELWYKLQPKYWNNGYATEAVKTILQFCFKELHLHRIEAGCAVENHASKRVLEKVGMIQEAHRRKLLPIRGEWVDNFEFAILETDFLHLSKDFYNTYKQVNNFRK
jgi:ribosomal-protein-alanine N-acetyltransferase